MNIKRLFRIIIRHFSRRKENDFIKLVYFDEASIMDYLILRKGNVNEFVKNVVKSDKSFKSAKIRSEMSVESDTTHIEKTNIYDIVAGLTGVDFSGELDLKNNFKQKSMNQHIAQYTLRSSILSEFFKEIRQHPNNNIERKDQCMLKIDSLDHSYSDMLSEGSIEDILSANKSSNQQDYYELLQQILEINNKFKGYWECSAVYSGGKVCTGETKQAIFKFNTSAFWNNYKIKDLQSMLLTMYVIKTGYEKKEKTIIYNVLVAGINKPD